MNPKCPFSLFSHLSDDLTFFFPFMNDSVDGRNDWEFGLMVYLVISVNELWRRQWHPTPVLLPGKSHGWRSLVGCSPWGREESETTE